VNREHWQPRLDVPKLLRPHFRGKQKLVQSTETRDRAVAKRRAAVLVAEWKREFELLRGQPTDPLEQEANWLRDALRKHRHDPEEVVLFEDHTRGAGREDRA
jgi:hypothetical protein